MGNNEDSQSWEEKITVGSAEVLEAIKKLIKEANVRKITVKSPSGKKILTIPASAGAAVGGLAVLTAPMVSAILAITALVTNVTLEVERTETVEGEVVDEDPEEGGLS